MSDDATKKRPRSATTGVTRAGRLRLLSLDHLDARTAAARRARELVDSIASDLGGEDHLTEGTRQLARRAAVLGAMIEHHECVMLAGGNVDFAEYLQAVNVQRRVFATIGLERRSRDVTPDPLEYAQRQAATE